MIKSVVYWLYDENCSTPDESGYVGITKCLKRRVAEHKKSLGRMFEVEVLFEGDRQHCFELEARLRPRPSMGWNNQQGGASGFSCRDSQSTKQKKRTAALNQLKNPTVKSLRVSYLLRQWAKPGARDNAGVRAKKHVHLMFEYSRSDENRKRLSEVSNKFRYLPEVQAKLAAARAKPEYREKQREIRKRLWEDPEFRAKVTARHRLKKQEKINQCASI